MAKVILGNRPKNFAPSIVKFNMPDGTEGLIPVVFVYRTRVEFGELLDSITKAVPAVPPEPAAEPVAAAKPAAGGKKAAAPAVAQVDPLAAFRIDYAAIYAGQRDQVAKHLALAIESWGLDAPLGEKALQQLASELPAGAIAIMAAYNVACTEGRLGN